MNDAIPDRATPRGMEPDPWHLGDDAVRPLRALGAVFGDLADLRLATDSSRGGETLDQVRARRGTIALSHQIIDFTLHGSDASPNRRAESETLVVLDRWTVQSWGRHADAIARWEHSPGDPRLRQHS